MATNLEGYKFGCTGKQEFATFAQAKRRARIINNRDTGHLEAYHCTHCNRFHVGGNRNYGRRDRRKDRSQE